MAFPSGLFMDDPDFQDISLHSLSTDPDDWSEEIIQKFKERIPRSASMSSFVKFMKKDEEIGAATGSIVVSDANQQVTIPVIVKDFKLYPLDVMIANERLLPLTPDYFNDVFSSNDIFSGLEEYPVFGGLGRFEDANLWNAVYPPSLGRYSYASAGYPIMDAISDTIDGSELKDYLKKNPEVAVNFKKNGHGELISKVANLNNSVNMNEYRQGVERLINRPISMLRRQGPNAYSILANSDEVFSPVITDVKRDELKKLLVEIDDDVQDSINEVDQNGEKILNVPTREENEDPHIYLAEGEKRNVVPADEFDHYVVRSSKGLEHEGAVIPTVIDFNMEKKDFKIFIGKSMQTVQPEIYGIRIQNLDNFNKLKGDKIRTGQTGTFVYQPNESKCLATIPVTIKSVTYDCGCIMVRCMDNLGGGYQLKFDPDNKDLQRIAKIGDTYCMPNGFCWVPMEGFDQISNSTSDFLVKQSGQKKTAAPVKVIPTGYNQYACRGLKKYAEDCGWDWTNLDRYKTKFLLCSLGAGPEKIGQILKTAQKTGQAEVHDLKFVPLESEKIAKAKPLAKKMKEVADNLRTDAIKEASYMSQSQQTVDSLLSLNFINPQNVSKFVNKLPALKSTISHLASLLIASRLGMEEIPEQATSTAMYKLIDVVNGLQTLKSKGEMNE